MSDGDNRAILCLICGEEELYFRRFIDALNSIKLGEESLATFYKAVYVGLTRPNGRTAGLWRSAEQFDHLPIPIKTIDVVWDDHFANARNTVHRAAAEEAEAVVWVDFDDLITPAILVWVRDFWHLQKSEQMQPKVHMSAKYLYFRDPDTGAPLIVQNKERLVFPASGWEWISPIHEVLSPIGGKEKQPTALVLSSAGIEHGPAMEVRDSTRNWKIMQKHWLKPLAMEGHSALGTREIYYLAVEGCRHRELGLLQLIRSAVLAKAVDLMTRIGDFPGDPADHGKWDRSEAFYVTNSLRMMSEILVEVGVDSQTLVDEHALLDKWACPIDKVVWGGVLNDLVWQVNKMSAVLNDQRKHKNLEAPQFGYYTYMESAPDGIPTFAPHYYNAMQEAQDARFAAAQHNDHAQLFSGLIHHVTALQHGRAENIDFVTEQTLITRLRDERSFPLPDAMSSSGVYNIYDGGAQSLGVPHELLGGGYYGEFMPLGLNVHTNAFWRDVEDVDALVGSGMFRLALEGAASSGKVFTAKRPALQAYFDGMRDTSSMDFDVDDDSASEAIALLETFKGGLPNRPLIMMATESALEPWNGETVRSSGIGGSESCMIYLAESLAGHGAEVYVFCPTPFNAKSVVKGVTYMPVERITEIVGEVDVFIASRSPRFLQKRWAKKQIFWLHDMPQPGQSYDVPNTDYIVVPSDYLARRVRPSAGKVEVKVVPHGVPFELLKWETQMPAGEEGTLRLLFSSQPERGLSGFSTLTMAAKQMLGADKVDSIALYGVMNYKSSVPDYQSWRKLRSWQHMAYQAGVNCTGRVPHFMSFESAKWANVLPYTSSGFPETYGLAPVEAYIAGAKLLLPTNCGATAELLDQAYEEGPDARVLKMPPFAVQTLPLWLEKTVGSPPAKPFKRAEAMERMRVIDVVFWESITMLKRWGLV